MYVVADGYYFAFIAKGTLASFGERFGVIVGEDDLTAGLQHSGNFAKRSNRRRKVMNDVYSHNGVEFPVRERHRSGRRAEHGRPRAAGDEGNAAAVCAGGLIPGGTGAAASGHQPSGVRVD